MTAGVFAKHGVWVGRSRNPDHRNQKGYFENRAMMRLFQKKWRDPAIHGLMPAMPGLREEMKDVLLAEGYPGGPWLFKCTALYGPAMLDAFPDALVVCPFRDFKQTVISCQKYRAHPYLDKSDMPWLINMHHDYMHTLCFNGAMPVYTDEVVAGNYESLWRALEAYPLKPNLSIIKDFVDPKLWHSPAPQ